MSTIFSEVEFDITAEQRFDLNQVLDRAAALKCFRVPGARVNTEMDWCAALNNGNPPISLQKLLSFDDFSFLHDIYGLDAHMNRETGHFGDRCFLPRCHKPERS